VVAEPGEAPHTTRKAIGWSAPCKWSGSQGRDAHWPTPNPLEAHVLWTLIIGLIVGALAKFIMPGRDPGGIIITILIGIAGSFIGTFIGRALGLYRNGQGAGFIMSLLGAILLLWIYRMVVSRRSVP
jgi:uncharacterized membrane protein YeaQ/YmgE (transglycosylase-associated protein family)